MIPFFRKIRKKMADDNKPLKYMRYAVGEILLVMIGILLALQVNTWNEARKQKNTLNAIYLITKEDLINDFIEIDSFIKNYEEIRKPAFETVLKTKITKQDWLENPQYKTVMLGFKDFAINQRGFELLKSQPILSERIEQTLASKINFFYNKHIVELNVAEKESSTEYITNNEIYKNYPWFSSYYLNGEIDGLIEFISNNPIAKNRITWYYLTLSIYVEELKNFRTNAKELMVQIDYHIKEN